MRKATFYLSTKGRMNRKHYGINILVIFVIGFWLLFGNTYLEAPIHPWILLIITNWLAAMAMAKRLHDINWSGKNFFWIIFGWIIGYIVLLFVEGDRIDNKYGKIDHT